MEQDTIPAFIQLSKTVAAISDATQISSAKPMRSFALQVVVVGGTTPTWTVRIEGSIDGSNWDTIATHTDVTLSGKIVFAVDKPVLFMRVNIVSVTGSPTSLDAYAMGVG